MIDIPKMATLVQSMLRKCLDAFVKRDDDAGPGVLLATTRWTSCATRSTPTWSPSCSATPTMVPRAVDLMFVARNLERIADHATNIAEDVVFLVKGIDVRHHAEQQQAENATKIKTRPPATSPA